MTTPDAAPDLSVIAPVVTRRAEAMISAHAKALRKDGALGKVARYLKGDHDLPYAPRGAKAEYRALAKKSVTNWLPLISDTYARALWVDGYRPAKSKDNAAPWTYWQANGLDARQSIPTRSALEFGVGYVLVLPGDKAPVIRPFSALKCQAFYLDDDDEWPVDALIHKGADASGAALYEYVDANSVYTLRRREGKGEGLDLVGKEDHGLGRCPVVRFRERLDGESVGIVAPLITIQDRINEAVFSLLIALQFASFRQRWATGLAIPVDENPFLDAYGVPTTVDTGVPNPNLGHAVEPFQAAVDRLWVSDSENAKFGDFAQTEVSGHLSAYDSAVRTLAAIAQVPPQVLVGDMVNLAADALAAFDAATARKGEGYETLFGEAWEQVLRLAAAADGNSADAADESAQVRWRDTEARALASTVDALGKMAQMLAVPAEALWERIPGVTDQDVQNWKAQAKTSDGLQALASALTKQAAPQAGSQFQTGTSPAA